MKQKNRALSEDVYIGIVEVCLKNGNLNHASYFLCQMDRLKINIPRKILDMFLDFSIKNKDSKEDDKTKENIVKEMIEENTNSTSKYKHSYDYYDYNYDYNYEEPEYNYYFKKKQNYKHNLENVKKDLSNMSELRLNPKAKPFEPRKSNDSSEFKINKITLNTNAKEFIPKKNN